MEISKENLAAVKKVVYDAFDNGKVKDVSMRFGFDSLGEEIVRVRLYVIPDTTVEDFRLRAFDLPEDIFEVLDGDLKGMSPHVEVRPI